MTMREICQNRYVKPDRSDSISNTKISNGEYCMGKASIKAMEKFNKVENQLDQYQKDFFVNKQYVQQMFCTTVQTKMFQREYLQNKIS